MNLRKRTYEILEVARPDDRLSRYVDFGLMGLISFNVLAVILESMPELYAAYQTQFDGFEIFSVFVFTIEYLLRLWAAAENPSRVNGSPRMARLRYAATPMAVIDLLVIAPFYLGFLFAVDLRFMRVLRLLRIFKLTRYSPAMSLLLQVFKDESRSIGAALFVLMLMIVMTASLTFLAEHEVQPEAFGTIPAAMWWAVITMTTVGYGDVVPMTVWGKILGGIIGIMGIGMVALPAGLLASGFSGALRLRRIQYEEHVEEALKDGVIDASEEEALALARLELGINEDTADSILEAEQRRTGVHVGVCPHCGKHLFARRAEERKKSGVPLPPVEEEPPEHK